MKVILLRDVAKLGGRFSVVDVPAGYAQNKLIPQGMAQPATPENLKRIEKQSTVKAADAAGAEEQFKALTAQLKDTPIVLTVDANEKGHLFQAVKVADIVTAASTAGLTVVPDTVHITEPIKAVGTHAVPLQLGSLQGDLTLEIVSK